VANVAEAQRDAAAAAADARVDAVKEDAVDWQDKMILDDARQNSMDSLNVMQHWTGD
jgi:hypothetical protein